MKTTTILSTLALALPAFAAPAPASTSPAAGSAPTGAYGGVAIRSGSDFQYASVNANGNNFWLLKDSSTYCPSDVECSNTTSTQFIGGANTLSLDTAVPGGQEVYVDSTGALRYTVPHSGNTGVGSSSTGFSVIDNGLYLQYNGDDFLACPEDSAYEVYAAAAVTNANSDCLGFQFRISPSTAPAAWEYN